MGRSEHSVSVAAAIVNPDGRIFLIRRADTGSWEPPGGILERDESILEGLRREVREETGFEIIPGPLTGVYKNMTLGVVALFFRAEYLSGEFSPKQESLEGEWLAPNSATDRMSPVFAIRVTDALQGGIPAVRIHDGRCLLAEG
jgi:8-oxo-dGTP pyrophosphatase MutT (NUDIX family)